jgi:hypothetical protein
MPPAGGSFCIPHRISDSWRPCRTTSNAGGISKVDLGSAYPRSPLTARKAYGFHERQTVVALGTRPRFTRYSAIGNAEVEMARAGLLWLLGIPIPILLIMWAFGWLH